MKIKTPNLRVRLSNWLRMRRFRKEQWHHWFAWYPVKATFTKYNSEHAEYLWLEKVRRRHHKLPITASTPIAMWGRWEWEYRSTDSPVHTEEINW